MAAHGWAGGVVARLTLNVLCEGRKYPSLLIWCGWGGLPTPVPVRPIVVVVQLVGLLHAAVCMW